MKEPTTPNARLWLAPALASLFLVAILAPGVTAGPLGPVPAAPAPLASVAFNVLTLKADGTVVAWLDAGSNRTTVHVQGAQPSAGGFNLADPYGRFVGADESSAAAGFVDFTGLHLLRGTYTFLGPNAQGLGAVLARFDLSSYGSQDPLAFTPPAHAPHALDAACPRAPAVWTASSRLNASVRGYDASVPVCAMRLDNGNACLMDYASMCAWAMSLAWTAAHCPDGNMTCVKAPSDPGPPKCIEPCGPCDARCREQWLVTVVARGIATAEDYIQQMEDLVQPYLNCNDGTNLIQCQVDTMASKDCGPNKNYACTVEHNLAQLVLLIQNDAGGGGGGIPDGGCTDDLVACVAGQIDQLNNPCSSLNLVSHINGSSSGIPSTADIYAQFAGVGPGPHSLTPGADLQPYYHIFIKWHLAPVSAGMTVPAQGYKLVQAIHWPDGSAQGMTDYIVDGSQDMPCRYLADTWSNTLTWDVDGGDYGWQTTHVCTWSVDAHATVSGSYTLGITDTSASGGGSLTFGGSYSCTDGTQFQSEDTIHTVGAQVTIPLYTGLAGAPGSIVP